MDKKNFSTAILTSMTVMMELHITIMDVWYDFYILFIFTILYNFL